MENKVKVFGKQGCQQCRMVKNFLEKGGYDFTYIDINEDATAMQELQSAGFKSLPVTKRKDGSYIVGFNVNLLRMMDK